ncbi:aldo/keto reductase [Cohnella sp. 56]|uniref:aldo/keto reductase n=1 Tax=Cohnella sp. 56 TaxID=3113722 RepID=UPI0030EA90ED
MRTDLPTAHTPSYIDEVSRYYLKSGAARIPYGIGCAWLGRQGTEGEALRRDLSVLDAAYARSFRYFDTSSAYGESEITLGVYLSALGAARDGLFVATKSRIPAALDARGAREHVRRQIEASRMRLQTDVIDLYQIHDVDGLDETTAPGGAIEALEEAKQAGKIRYAGLATRNLELLAAGAGDGRFDTVLTYSDYTPIDQTASELILKAGSRGVGVINGTPLSAGLLAGGDPAAMSVPLWHAESVLRQRRAASLYRLCSGLDVSMLHVALQYPLRCAGIHMNLTGPSTTEELDAGCAAMLAPLPDSCWQAIDEWNAARLSEPAEPAEPAYPDE